MAWRIFKSFLRSAINVALKILGVELFGLVIVNQPLNGFLVVGLQQFKNFGDVFLADENVALVELGNDALRKWQ